jgi:hypothetical protein
MASERKLERLEDAPAVHHVVPNVDMLEFQNDLPRLPVPELVPTFQKLFSFDHV